MYSSTLPLIGAVWRWIAIDTSQSLYPRECHRISILRKAGQFPGPVRTRADKLAPTRIRSPDRPAGSKSLYGLRYPGPQEWVIVPICTFFLLARQPSLDHALLILEVSRSHTTTHHSR